MPVKTPDVGIASFKTPEIKTPPLPKQPTTSGSTNVLPAPILNTGLTATETALLSPDEQAIRLKQKGIA